MRRQNDEGSDLAWNMLMVVIAIIAVLWIIGTAGSCASEFGGIL